MNTSALDVPHEEHNRAASPTCRVIRAHFWAVVDNLCAMMFIDDSCPRSGPGPYQDERLDDLQLTEGLRVADRFRLVRLLGQGGMGSVWLADHLALDIPCAIKFIDREPNSADARRRFEREAKAAAQLRGQHVVQILDHGVWEGVPYIAMEYLEGEDLAARLERLGRLAHGQTARIIAQVAKGLGRAHAAGIVHRDLKPENIFLTKDGDDDVVKVLDFGIAKRSQTSLSEAGTKTGSLLGTPFHMSPEQARGVKGIDHRSDLLFPRDHRLPVRDREAAVLTARVSETCSPKSCTSPSRFLRSMPRACRQRSTPGGCARRRVPSRSASKARKRWPTRCRSRWALAARSTILFGTEVAGLLLRRSFGRRHPVAAATARLVRSPPVG